MQMIVILLLKIAIEDTLDNSDVNEDKTEKTTHERTNDKNKENWMMAKKLGSLLGDTEGVTGRKQLAAAPTTKMDKMWIRWKKIDIK